MELERYKNILCHLPIPLMNIYGTHCGPNIDTDPVMACIVMRLDISRAPALTR